MGGILGAGVGAIIGNQIGDAGEGALIGGALGAITAGAIGDNAERSRYRTRQVVYVPAVQPTRRVVRTYKPTRRAGHYEIRLVRGASGELYEDRVWIYDD